MTIRPETLEREKDKLPYPPPFQDLATLAKHICAGESTIERWVRLGKFPPPKKMVGGKQLWAWRDVERFMEQDDNGSSQTGESICEAAKRVSKGRTN